jgi:nitroimidazol reductase NimA-like FMN-containing flavoprotein (pyridoxamine 5'-phosphate oxidase superfamily)
MDDAARDAFLRADPAIVAAIATLRADGSPWVVPVWYRWDGAVVSIWSEPEYPWVRRLAHDPRVSFTVFEQRGALRAIYLAGVAQVRAAPLAELRAEIEAIVSRYCEPADVGPTIMRFERGAHRAIVTIEPATIRAIANLEE